MTFEPQTHTTFEQGYITVYDTLHSLLGHLTAVFLATASPLVQVFPEQLPVVPGSGLVSTVAEVGADKHPVLVLAPVSTAQSTPKVHLNH